MLYCRVMTKDEDRKKSVLFSVRVPPKVKERMQALLDHKHIGDGEGCTQLFEWFLRQDDLLQSMLLGQVDPAIDVTNLVLKRFQEQARKTA